MISQIKILEFKFKHYDLLLSMLNDRKTEWIQEISYKTLPKIGYIAMFGKQPIAAGFLRKLEGGYARLDTFVTSPHFGNKIRNNALNLIVDELLRNAEELELLGVMAVTKAKVLSLELRNEIPCHSSGITRLSPKS